jgi:hypothetical protein
MLNAVRTGVQRVRTALAGTVVSERPDPSEPVETVSLVGNRGAEVVRNLALLASGGIHISELGSGYYRDPDGTIGIHIDDESARELDALLRDSGECGKPAAD